jgi:oligoribonuclease NrnB/cAMP/cGMP phosphodiesterase (DHH superfamily)
MNKIVIIYHNNCMDGFGAAYAAWKKYGKEATYIPADYNKPIPEVADGCEVYIMDVSFKREEMIELNRRSKKVVVLDHHETAKENLVGLDFCIFDMNKSGARLSWEYFHPDTPAPFYIKYIEDRDLWRFKLKNSLAFNTAVFALPFDFEAWDKALPKKMLMMKNGEAILGYQNKILESSHQEVNFVSIFGHENIPCVNTFTLQSDICDSLNKKYLSPFALCYHVRKKGKVKWSIRSVPGGLNVRQFAATLGGGGHNNASGFSTSKKFLNEVLSTARDNEDSE